MNPRRARPSPAEPVPDRQAPGRVVFDAEQVGAEHPGTPDPTRDYLRRIGRTPLLDAGQEVDLARRVEAGLYAADRLHRPRPGEPAPPAALERDLRAVVREGEAARDALLEANLRLVVYVAKRYTGRGVPLLDLIQEGNLGLIHAVKKFDYTKGYKFSTYATWWIRQSVARAVANQGRTIRIPVHVADQISSITRGRQNFVRDHGRAPTAQELADDLGLSIERVQRLQRLDRDPVSLDQPVGGEAEARLSNFIEDPNAVAPDEAATTSLLRRDIRILLADLTTREAGIIGMRFGLFDGLPHTLDEVGRVYGVGRERIRQVEAHTMTKLRNPRRSRHLHHYLT